MITYHNHRSEMTIIALTSGLEVIRTKLFCAHRRGTRQAILLVNGDNIVRRMIRCKVCKKNVEGTGNE